MLERKWTRMITKLAKSRTKAKITDYTSLHRSNKALRDRIHPLSFVFDFEFTTDRMRQTAIQRDCVCACPFCHNHSHSHSSVLDANIRTLAHETVSVRRLGHPPHSHPCRPCRRLRARDRLEQTHPPTTRSQTRT